MVIRQTVESDYDKLRPRGFESFQKDTVDTSDMTFSCVDGEEVVAIGGFCPAYEGCEGVWMVMSDDARGHALEVTKLIKRLCDTRQMVKGLFRLQALVRPDNYEYNRFIRLLGFELEGLMRKANEAQEDQFLYARIW